MPQQEYEIIAGVVVTIVVILLGGFFILVLVTYINRRKKGHIDEKKTMQSNFRQELLRTQLEIQEQTLKYISQEIHDNIGQILSLAKLNLGTVDLNKIDTLKQKIEDSKNLVAKAIQDLRDLSKSLNTDYVSDMGLARSIEYELEMIKKTGSFEADFEIEGEVCRLEQQKELILFRIVQEILSNIIKHAAATVITVKLSYQTRDLFLTVTDNGRGFDLSAIEDNRNATMGLGIKNMHNRAQLIGARFSMSSTLNEGTIVNIYLPAPA